MAASYNFAVKKLAITLALLTIISQELFSNVGKEGTSPDLTCFELFCMLRLSKSPSSHLGAPTTIKYRARSLLFFVCQSLMYPTFVGCCYVFAWLACLHLGVQVKIKINRLRLSILQRLTRGQETLLLRAGDVEENPGPPAASVDKPDKKQLSVIHVNAHSLLCHHDDVATLLMTKRPHILALSETWLDSSVADQEIHFPGYCLFRSDRNRYGGGVAIYCVENLPCYLLCTGTSPNGVEYLWITVKSNCLNPIAFGCFYRPPAVPSQSVFEVCDSIENMMLSYKYMVACGDFNIDMLDTSKSHSKTLQNFITSHSLIQPISTPTRHSCSSASILDLFLATCDVPISRSSVLNTAFSDHLPIALCINSSLPCPQPTLITRRSFKHFSKSSFHEDLSIVPWSILDIFDDPDDKVDEFNLLFSDVLHHHAPVKQIRVKKKPSPWISKTIRKEMDRRDRLFRFYRRNPSTASWDIYKAQRNRVVWLQRKAKIEHFQQLLLKRSHPSALWKTLNITTCSSVSTDNWSSFVSSHKCIANTLNNHFASVSSNVTHTKSVPSSTSLESPTSSVISLAKTTPDWCKQALSNLKTSCATGLEPVALIAARSIISYPLSSIINCSIASSCFPTQWKCAAIKPLHKGGDRAVPSNYRPISILPVSSKLLERHIHLQLSGHLNSNSLLFPFQSGFRPSHSTQTLLLHCCDKWYKALDDRKFIGVAFLDISKAFDTVNHELLLSKLSILGLSTSAVSWFQSYLSNRSHVTPVAESYSSPGFPTSGVPQGSILGPTLFSIFINDLPSVLPPDITVLFADDTTIYIVGENIATIQSSLQLCLDLAHLWLQKHGLKLNPTKTKSMLIHSSKKVVDRLQLNLKSTPIEQVHTFKFLGVVVNDTLTWTDHIDMECKKVSRKLNLLRRLSWFLPRSLLLLFLKSYILPQFDYCDVVWCGCTKSESTRLESLLNFACRTVLRRSKHSSASAARQELHLSTLSSRRKLHLSQAVFKCLSSQSPPYLSTLFSTPNSSHYTRSHASSQLNLPPSKSSFGQRAFSFSGASMWRLLPPTIREIKDFTAFTAKCQDFLLH